MSLRKDAINQLNTLFEKMEFPMVVNKIFFYRPAYFETYYENYEPIDDVNRLFGCNPIYINIEITYKDRECEYDLRYRNDDNKLVYRGCVLKYWDYDETEDPQKIRTILTEIMDEIAAIVIPGALHAVLKNNEN